MTLAQLAQEYYRPLVPMIRSGRRNDKENDTVIYPVPELDVRIAVEERLSRSLEAERPEDAAQYLAKFAEAPQMAGDEPLGPDGIAVLPGDSWF